jgi:hypothetical protein
MKVLKELAVVARGSREEEIGSRWSRGQDFSYANEKVSVDIVYSRVNNAGRHN